MNKQTTIYRFRLTAIIVWLMFDFRMILSTRFLFHYVIYERQIAPQQITRNSHTREQHEHCGFGGWNDLVFF